MVEYQRDKLFFSRGGEWRVSQIGRGADKRIGIMFKEKDMERSRSKHNAESVELAHFWGLGIFFHKNDRTFWRKKLLLFFESWTRNHLRHSEVSTENCIGFMDSSGNDIELAFGFLLGITE